MDKNPSFRLRCVRGRLFLELRLLPAGDDWQLLLTGGAAHIGAVVLAEPAREGSGTAPRPPAGVLLHVLRRTGHRDDEAALPLARDYCRALGATVCVSAGIHFDDISREEIDTILDMARTLGARGLRRLRRQEESMHADSEGS